MPDALSKTVPIWCCVMNRAIFPETGPHKLYTPPTAVSASEHAQIEKRLEGFVRDFLVSLFTPVPPLSPIEINKVRTFASQASRTCERSFRNPCDRFGLLKLRHYQTLRLGLLSSIRSCSAPHLAVCMGVRYLKAGIFKAPQTTMKPGQMASRRSYFGRNMKNS